MQAPDFDLRVPFAFFFIVGLLVGIGGCALANSGWLPTIKIEYPTNQGE